MPVLTSTTLVATDDFTVREVACAGGGAHWSGTEQVPGRGVVLVRAGMFRVRDNGRPVLADVTAAYVQVPGHEQQFAHPHGGDSCTSVTVTEAYWTANFAGVRTDATVPVDARLELAHLRLRRRARAGDDAAEELLDLVAHAVRATPPRTIGSPRAARLAGAAREAVLAGNPGSATLGALAAQLGVSPYHLSRVFSAHVGAGLTRFRNRVRVSRAMARLADGEDNLARLAADLGFADQAHLTRTVRAQLGRTPSQLRRHLTAA